MRRSLAFDTILHVVLATAFLLATAAAAAEQGERVRRVAYVGITTPENAEAALAALRDSLARLGYVEGRNLVLETRWARGDTARLADLMSEVVAQKVEVIVTAGTPGAVAAKNATGSIPIIAVAMADPVRTGLVTNLARPEGNLTGLSMGYGDQFVGKWLELLREIVPSLSSVAVISNPDNAVFRPLKQDVVAAASKLNLKIQMLDVRTAEAIDDTFKRARKEAQAVLLLGDPLTLTQKRRIAKLAAVHRLPAVYNHRSFVDEGGLMSYAPDTDVQVRRAAEYVDQILKGRKIADLPVEYPTAFKLVVNAQAAKAAGLVLPGSLLSRADETLR